VLTQQRLALVPSRFDQLLECEPLFPQRFANSVERLRRNDFLGPDQHTLRRFNDRDQIPFLDAKVPPDRCRQGYLAFFLDSDEVDCTPNSEPR